jgi:hypothetical protein
LHQYDLKGRKTIKYLKKIDKKKRLLDGMPQKVNEVVLLVSGRISYGWQACLFQSPAALPYELVKVFLSFSSLGERNGTGW